MQPHSRVSCSFIDTAKKLGRVDTWPSCGEHCAQRLEHIQNARAGISPSPNLMTIYVAMTLLPALQDPSSFSTHGSLHNHSSRPCISYITSHGAYPLLIKHGIGKSSIKTSLIQDFPFPCLIPAGYPVVILHSYWKWHIEIVDLPIKDCDFP